MKLISQLEGIAATTTFSAADFRQWRTGLLIHAGDGLLVLLMALTLSVYKPWGLTSYGQRKQQERRKVPQQVVKETPFGLKVFLSVIGGLVLIFLAVHLAGHGMDHHGH